jgi:hypothetical protein
MDSPRNLIPEQIEDLRQCKGMGDDEAVFGDARQMMNR